MTNDYLPVASEIKEIDVSQQQQDVQIFQAPDGQIRLDVKFQQDTVWLTQAQMTVLFERDQSVISRHINNVFKDGELSAESTMQKMHIAHSDKPTACYPNRSIHRHIRSAILKRRVRGLPCGPVEHFLGPLVQTFARQLSSHRGLAVNLGADPEHNLP